MFLRPTNCPICGGTNFFVLTDHHSLAPDKYERAAGIDGQIQRRWEKCLNCGLYVQKHNYPAKMLNPCYEFAYRSEDFRESSIQEEYNRIRELPEGVSENLERIKWLVPYLHDKDAEVFQMLPRHTVLDIGAGLGIFANSLKNNGFIVSTVEANHESVEWMQKLMLDSYQGFFPEGIPAGKKWDIATAVHVLEHQESPKSFLDSIHEVLKVGGKLYIEVPDSSEFNYLDSCHDEFNSTHLTFFDPSTLCRLVESCGFRVTDLHRHYYKHRKLTRLFLLALKR